MKQQRKDKPKSKSDGTRGAHKEATGKTKEDGKGKGRKGKKVLWFIVQ